MTFENQVDLLLCSSAVAGRLKRALPTYTTLSGQNTSEQHHHHHLHLYTVNKHQA